MSKSKYITRLKRSEGQLRGIQKMIEEERDCMDIMIQLSAVRSSVDRVIELLITENLIECINKPLQNPDDQKEKLEKAGITCNKNAIPNDPEKPFITSGVRLGTPAITARGFKEEETKLVAKFILEVLNNIDDDKVIEEVKKQVLELTKKFPLYKNK